MQRDRSWGWLAAVAVAAMVLGGVIGSPALAAPAGYPVTGIDVSAYQGDIDWAAVAAGGAKFAYARASEQADIPDRFFSANYRGAKANGLYIGAYHRARPDVSGGKAQADFFVDNAQYVSDGRTLPPMLDIEWPRSTWSGLNACYNLTPTQLAAWIRDFVDEVARRTGRLAVIYTNPNWWNPCTNSNATFGANPLFNSGYTPSPPPPPAGWSTWTFWQYANSGTLPGDQDVFNGTYAALTRLAGAVPLSLRAHANGRYVTAESAGSKPLIANRTAIGPWEQFDQVDAGGGYIALRAHANGRYVTAESAGTKPLIANRTAIGPWEKFKLVVNADGVISLLANANGRYVTAEHAGTSPLIANRTAIGPWEQFDQVDVGGGDIALRAHANGRYVTTDATGSLPLIASATAIGPLQRFRLILNPNGSISLLAKVNLRYVTAEHAGGSPLIANRTAIGPWEQFYRTPG